MTSNPLSSFNGTMAQHPHHHQHGYDGHRAGEIEGPRSQAWAQLTEGNEEFIKRCILEWPKLIAFGPLQNETAESACRQISGFKNTSAGLLDDSTKLLFTIIYV